MKRYFHTWHLIGLALVTANFGGKDNIPNISLEQVATYKELEEGERSFYGLIQDKNVGYEVKDFSFSGVTTLQGVYNEKDDSITCLKLDKIKKIEVKNPHYESRKYNKFFTLIKVKSITGEVLDDLLIPETTVIGGIDTQTLLPKTWFVSKIDVVKISNEKFSLSRDSKPLVETALPSLTHKASEQDVKEKVQKPEKLQEQYDIKVSDTKVDESSSNKGQLNFEVRRGGLKSTGLQQANWDEFYRREAALKSKEQQSKTVGAAFLGIFDAIIDFFRACLRFFMSLLGRH